MMIEIVIVGVGLGLMLGRESALTSGVLRSRFTSVSGRRGVK
jgi:hypothetical protein